LAIGDWLIARLEIVDSLIADCRFLIADCRLDPQSTIRQPAINQSAIDNPQ